MMKLIVVGAAVMAGALGAFGASDAELAKLVAEDLSRPVRPGGVGGQEFWNANAQGFVYPPAPTTPSGVVGSFFLACRPPRSSSFLC